MKSTVSEYEDGHQFITYCEVTVWATNSDDFYLRKVVLRVLLTDNMEKIKIYLDERQQFTNIELKLCMVNSNVKPNKGTWNEGKTLKADDTIMSCQLYQDNCIIMATLMKTDVN
jgi:hypothetical protein